VSGFGTAARILCRVALVLLLSVVAVLPAGAAISVSPTSIKVSASAPTSVIRLTNTGSRAVDMQVRVMAWTHDTGGDRLEPTTDLAASPPFVRIEPGASQAIRVGLRGGGAPAYYRLLVSEIAAPSEPGTINFALTFSVPVIAGAQMVGEPRLAWTARRAGSGLDLIATDLSPWHATIADLVVADGSGRSVAPSVVGTSAVVLPGRERRWIVSGLGGASGRLVLTGTMNGAPFRTTVDVGAP
jgi:fimbrial chaperone protein